MSTAIAFSWPRRWRSGASISIGCLLRSLWPALLLPLLGGCPSGSARQPPSEDGTPAAPRGTTFSKSFGGDNWDAARAAIATSDGGYAFVGTVNSTGDEGVGDLWISKLDANGNIDWQRAIGDITPASANRLRSISAVRATPDGGFILAGSSSSGQSPADADVWVAKLSSAGAVEWSRDYDSGPWTEAFASSQFGREARADDRATDVQVAPDGGFVVAASSLANVVTSSGQVHVNAQSIFVMRLTATGEVRWQRRLNDGPSMELSLGGAFSLIARPTHDEGAVVAVGLVASDRIRIVRLDSGGERHSPSRSRCCRLADSAIRN
jgi:hypothetical protein